MTRTLLSRLDELLNVDVDDADYTFLEKIPVTIHNQTSNQRVINLVLEAPQNRRLLEDCIRKHGREGWDKVLDRISVLICAKNLALISGRVLVQTTPGNLNNFDAIVKQCHEFAQYFAEAGVSRDRYAIKIPFSGAGAIAAAKLNAEGIRTLATSVFCLEQAIAASQSKCVMISPYFNETPDKLSLEIAAKFDESLRPNVQDVALEHPMSPRVVHMLELFTRLYLETKEEQPVMVIASHLNPQEILAMAEVGCQHVTISQANLLHLMTILDDQPAVTKPKPTHPYAGLATSDRLRALSHLDYLAPKDWDGTLASSKVDYLAEKGRVLEAAIDRDSVARKRINDAMDMFIDFENKSKAVIEKEIGRILDSS